MNDEVTVTSTETLECGHSVDLAVGTVVFNYYDGGFGRLVRLDWSLGVTGYDRETLWHDYESLGAPYWAKGARTHLDRTRIVCVPCGHAYEARRPPHAPARWVDPVTLEIIPGARP